MVTLGALVWMLTIAEMPPGYLLTGFGLLEIPMVFISVAGLVLAVIGGLTGNRALTIIGAAFSVAFGTLALLWGELMILLTLQDVGPVRLAVTAPGHAQALLALLIGLTAPLLGLGLLQRRRS